MLHDRRALLLQEIAKKKKECADLYLKSITSTGTALYNVYAFQTAELSKLESELRTVEYLLTEGPPKIK